MKLINTTLKIQEEHVFAQIRNNTYGQEAVWARLWLRCSQLIWNRCTEYINETITDDIIK